MHPLRHLCCFLLGIAVPLTVYTWFFRHLDGHCAWPAPRYGGAGPAGAVDGSAAAAAAPAARMLLFADPQIRGVGPSTDARTKVDIFGNDHFLGHLYRRLYGGLKPSHVVVLGDLFSSQWISDEQFAVRTARFRSRIFSNFERAAELGFEPVNVSGNHDVGYAWDMTAGRVDRWQREFGELNFARDYDGWRLVVVGAMALDGPAEHTAAYHTAARAFVQAQIDRDYDGTTVLVTHVPLYKPAGLCVDPPLFSFYDEAGETETTVQSGAVPAGARIREQNQLSAATSRWLLDGLFRRGGVVLTGHDHEGCAVDHVRTAGGWTAQAGSNVSHAVGPALVRELTVRSMMGEFGSNAGLLSAYWNASRGAHDFYYSLCSFGPQQVWWASYALLAAVGAVFSASCVL
ncbi:putative conserved phosphoesterase domain-containing protein [Dipodascopsis tothii]|uniref:putative conserved phosphoesterase domain-containing protein n=1 Tax=Dipodascopsis tothii TaxID=44089 RepID=UPI0034CF9491